MKKIYALGIALILLPLAVEAEPLELGSGGGVTARVQLDRRLQLLAVTPERSLGGFLSCEVNRPGREPSSPCPALSAVFSSRDVVEASPQLKSLWEAPPAEPAVGPPRFWMEQNALHYSVGPVEFVRDIGSYFLPRTRIVRQWAAQSHASDVLFVLSETCDDEQGCRNGMWFFVIGKGEYSARLLPAFRTSLIPLAAKIDETRLEAGPKGGIFSAAARVAVVLPSELGTIAVSWVADLETTHGAGFRSLLFEIYPIPPPVEP